MAKKILVGLRSGVLADEDLARVAAAAPGYEVVVARERSEQAAALEGAEIAFGPVPFDLVAAAPRLKWFQQWSAGSDWLRRHPEVVAGPLVVTNASGVHAVPISEHILALLLAFARNLPRAFDNQRESRWPGKPPAVFELAGRTALIVGLGAIGARTARLLHALDVRVLGVRRHLGAPALPGVERVGALDELLPLADFVILTVPLTAATEGMVGAAQLASMKPTAHIVNIGRGLTVDEAALARALQDGTIAGAGLDVFEEEPLPVGSPLWGLPNVIVTTHYAGATPAYADRAFDIFVANLRRYLRGEPLENVVDKTAGY